MTAAEQLPKFLAGDPALGAAASGGALWLHRPQSSAELLVPRLILCCGRQRYCGLCSDVSPLSIRKWLTRSSVFRQLSA